MDKDPSPRGSNGIHFDRRWSAPYELLACLVARQHIPQALRFLYGLDHSQRCLHSTDHFNFKGIYAGLGIGQAVFTFLLYAISSIRVKFRLTWSPTLQWWIYGPALLLRLSEDAHLQP